MCGDQNVQSAAAGLSEKCEGLRKDGVLAEATKQESAAGAETRIAGVVSCGSTAIDNDCDVEHKPLQQIDVDGLLTGGRQNTNGPKSVLKSVARQL